MEIYRNIQNHIKTLLNQFPIVAIIGARQSGKTTLSKLLCPDWLYVDLENPGDFDRINYDPLLFFEQNSHNVIIDEAQILPDLFPILRGIIDNDRQAKGRFILTGSSSPDLLKNISESLAGRIAYIELPTLKTNEFNQTKLSEFYNILSSTHKIDDFHNLKTSISLKNINQHWLYGGYPEPRINGKKDFWLNWIEQYNNTYINRDISLLFPKLNKINFRRFLQILTTLSNTIINKSDLARDLEISQPTIHEYLEIVSGTFIWRNLPSYESKKIKSIIKMPKGYIRDSGLLHFLNKIFELEHLYNNIIVGRSFEGFIIEEIIKGIQAQGIIGCDYYHYRTRGGAEIDLILEGNFGLIPIEIKYSSHTTIKQLRSLTDFIRTHNLNYGIVINQAKEITKLTKNIIQIPANFL